MTQVQIGDEVIETDLPAEAVADLQETEKQPEETPQPEPQAETPEQPVKTADPAEEPEEALKEQPKEPEGRFNKKATPIANLLEKKHELETALEAERQAKADLEAKIAQLSQQAPSAQTDDKISALAEKHGIDPEVLQDIVSTAREGMGLPKEVQDLLQERQVEKQRAEEMKAFEARVSSLAKTFPSEQFKDPEVKEKLLQLAYSTEKAPDGEPYYQKELSELYFAFIKPEVEPGRATIEDKKGGKSGQEILDFEAIHGDDAKLDDFAKNATSEQWASYTKWRDAKQGDVPIRRL